MWGTEKMRERWRKRGSERRQAGEKFTSTVGWSRKSCNIAAARKQQQMSHVSPSLIPSLYPSSSLIFLSPSFCRVFFLFSLLCSPSYHSQSLGLSVSLFLTPSPHCTLSPMMSGAVWLVLKPDYSPQWAHFTPPGLMPASQAACVVLQLTDIQRPASLLALIRMHTVDWKEEREGKKTPFSASGSFSPLFRWAGREEFGW